ncbi:MAG: Omp28-related outer membrane protein [Bacteroidetes bacterium]|nr:Omp28-related outer membrane protein [Bacteroidota bacterium]
MKKILLIASAVALTMTVACKKKKTTETTKAPTSYTKKGLIEYFSGAWCGYCPDGWIYATNIMNANPGKVNAIVFHYGDLMANNDGLAVNTAFNSAGYPTGMTSRVGGKTESRSAWTASMNNVLGEAAKCGLALDATTNAGGEYTVKVKLGIGAADMPAGNYKLHVYAISKKLTGTGTGWDQANYYSKASSAAGGTSHPFYNLANPIVGYEHHNVMRGALTGQSGVLLNADQLKAGAITNLEYKWTPDDAANTFFVAIIHEQSVSVNTSYVYNCQWVDAGANKAWD